MHHVIYQRVSSNMDGTCRISMSHVGCIFGLVPHTNASCHISTRRVTHQRGMSSINGSCNILISHGPYPRVTSHINQLCSLSFCMYKCIISHINESRAISTSHGPYQSVTSHINQSCSLSFCMYKYIIRGGYD